MVLDAKRADVEAQGKRFDGALRSWETSFYTNLVGLGGVGDDGDVPFHRAESKYSIEQVGADPRKPLHRPEQALDEFLCALRG